MQDGNLHGKNTPKLSHIIKGDIMDIIRIIPSIFRKGKIIPQEKMESDYQLAKQLQKIGYIKTDWYVAPINLYGEVMLREYQ